MEKKRAFGNGDRPIISIPLATNVLPTITVYVQRHICSYLCWLDILAYRYTCKAARNGIVQPNLFKLIESYLTNELKLPNVDRLATSLQQANGWLSGSLPVAAMYGFPQDWKVADVDIFVQIGAPVMQFMYSLQGLRASASPETLKEWKQSTNFNPKGVNCKQLGMNLDMYGRALLMSRYFNWDRLAAPNDHEAIDPQPDFVINWVTIGFKHDYFKTIDDPLLEQKVELSWMDKLVPGWTNDILNQRSPQTGKQLVLNYIDKYFDLDCCRVATNGQQLYILRLDNLWNRTCHVDYKEQLEFRQRQARGYVNATGPPGLWYRFIKYVKRGFRIRLTDSSSQAEPIWLVLAYLDSGNSTDMKTRNVKTKENAIMVEIRESDYMASDDVFKWSETPIFSAEHSIDYHMNWNPWTAHEDRRHWNPWGPAATRYLRLQLPEAKLQQEKRDLTIAYLCLNQGFRY